MKIRTRLTLLFSAIFATLLLTFAFVVFLAYSQNRRQEYYDRLREQAVTKADLLLDAQVAPSVLQVIYRHTTSSPFQEEVAIYDTAFHLLYHDAVEVDKVKETPLMIKTILQQRELRFEQANTQVIGFLHHRRGISYVITAAGHDELGLAKMRSLGLILVLSLLGAVGLLFLIGYFLARKALEPVAQMVSQVSAITASNLDRRVLGEAGQDELAELARTFNQMLDRLEHSFDAQRQFVSNIAHELRTPLSAIVAELDLAAARKRTIPDYRAVIERTSADARKLVRLSNGLFDLAKANYDPSEIAFRALRIDEILLDARQDLLRANSAYTVELLVELEGDNADVMSMYGNEYLLRVAFKNLLENGCKFSADHRCTVTLTHTHRTAILHFDDQGIGIPPDELVELFKPFYRGRNAHHIHGNGIGLPLTQRIIHLHKGIIRLTSRLNEGTTVTVELPHV